MSGIKKTAGRIGIGIGISLAIVVFVLCLMPSYGIKKSEEKQNIGEKEIEKKFSEKGWLEQKKNQTEDQAEEEPEWGQVKEEIQKYQEIKMPYHVSEYLDYGIWDAMFDIHGNLCSFGKNYDGKSMLILWNEKKQKEKEFLPVKTFPKARGGWPPAVVPYKNGKQKGYIIYQKMEERKPEQGVDGLIKITKKYVCYFVKEDGELIQKISLEKFLKKKKIKNKTVLSGIIPLKKNKIAVIMEKNSGEKSYQDIPNYALIIDIEKNKLIAMETYDYGIVEMDENYCYAVQYVSQNDIGAGYAVGAASFLRGNFLIIDRKTKKQKASIQIPRELGKVNINMPPVHYFDVKNGAVYLANRTGVYYVKPGDLEWTKVMDSEQSSYLNKEYTLVDFIVENKNEFYLLSYFDEDSESADYLTKYKRKR